MIAYWFAIFGNLSLSLLAVFSLLYAGFILYAWRKDSYQLTAIVPWYHYIAVILIGISFLILISSFILGQSLLAYVAQHYSPGLLWWEKIAATWSAHEGSLLLWLFYACIWGLFFTRKSILSTDKAIPLASGIYAFIIAFWAGFIVWTASPFTLQTSPVNNIGLNPLLHDIGLAIHPSSLMFGFPGLGLIYALSMAYAWHGRIHKENLRRLFIGTFAFLTLGISLGSWWAYRELGWGGFWFWDPIENIALIPWILCLMALHLSHLADNNRLNRSLITLSLSPYIFLVLGTFVLRTGLISSVHAFAQSSTIAWGLGGFIIILIFSALWTIKNYSPPSSTRIPLQSFSLSILGQQWLLGCFLLVLIIGTFYPILVSLWGGRALSLGHGYYNSLLSYLFPIFLLTLAVNLGKEKFLFILSSSLIFSFLQQKIWILSLNTGMAYALIITILFSLIQDIRKPHKIMPHLCHIGFIMSIIGILGSSIEGENYNFSLTAKKPQEFALGKIELKGFSSDETELYQRDTAFIEINFNPKLWNISKITLKPEVRLYKQAQSNTSEMYSYSSWHGDIMAVLGQPQGNDISLSLYIRPWIHCIWLGALILFLGLLGILYRKNKAKL